MSKVFVQPSALINEVIAYLNNTTCKSEYDKTHYILYVYISFYTKLRFT